MRPSTLLIRAAARPASARAPHSADAAAPGAPCMSGARAAARRRASLPLAAATLALALVFASLSGCAAPAGAHLASAPLPTPGGASAPESDPSTDPGAPPLAGHSADREQDAAEDGARLVRTGPYYAELSESERASYLVIASAIESAEQKVVVDGSLGDDVLGRVLNAILFDRPDLFWFTGAATGSVSNGQTTLILDFSVDRNTLNAKRAALDAAVENIVSPLEGLSPAAQQKAAHDYIAQHVAYDPHGPQNGQTAYNALVEGKSVCAGYARAFQLVMIELGIPCSYVSGEAQGQQQFEEGAWTPHAWNIVEMDGHIYNVDVTWDDSPLFEQEAVLYTDFNMTDDDFAANHQRGEESAFLPACDGEPFDFEAAYGVDRARAAAEHLGIAVAGEASTAEEFQALMEEQAAAAEGFQTSFYLVVYGDDLVASLTDLWKEPVRSAFETQGFQGSITFNSTSQNVGGDAYLVRIAIGQGES
ncbi:transglutaminase domain-containing protein [Xiamenia xianingshaonis]|uniref:Transglutaminase-like domain-containing protein n=1 Tax=Xiamenia xianingshaonis TaxID=2682776 RepID=A0ABX0IHL8_9ACTN|nr:transglutaminase domain-containing protein [Xiamenia xianingshaonis]NHM13527.1 hypothetical protein [Xiamenia xianingshaonis]